MKVADQMIQRSWKENNFEISVTPGKNCRYINIVPRKINKSNYRE